MISGGLAAALSALQAFGRHPPQIFVAQAPTMTTYGVAARRNSTEPGSMAYMAKDGPDITQKVLGDEAFNNKWGCKNNIEPDGTKGPHREWRFGKCRDCGMGEGKYNTAFQEWKEKQEW